MTTNAAPGLLEELIHHPEDDAPRLILADWWDDWGSPADRARAELIRLQIQRERRPGIGQSLTTSATGITPPRSPGSSSAELLQREEGLIRAHDDLWRRELPQRGGIRWSTEYTRGFVEQFTADSPQAFLQHAPDLFAAAPVRSARILRLTTREDLLSLFRSPWLQRLHELDLGRNHLDPPMQSAFAEFPLLPRLESLLLHHTDLGAGGLESLLRGPGLPRLKELYLAGNQIRDTSLAVLSRSDCFPALELLDLRDNRFGSGGLYLLAQSPALQGLRHLWLVNNWIGDSGLAALCDAGVSRLPHLESLWLNWNSVGDRGAAVLARDPARTALRDLDLRDCHIEDAGGLALAHSPWLENLHSLQMSGNRFSTATVRALRERYGRRVRV
jgi:uncharacterized protein (TIGR02996 family)